MIVPIMISLILFLLGFNDDDDQGPDSQKDTIRFILQLL